jgi:transposase, IS5 family
MAIDLSGKNSLIEAGIIEIEVKKNHPLIMLANSLPWDILTDLVVADLKVTTSKGHWFTGRKVKVRIHLGAYLLQRIYNLTDRKTEYQIKDNAAFQLFCGINTVESWNVPDHTKIEKFRNRLSPETQRIVANSISKTAVELGFADPREVDFDSTVQEANIIYPSDASIMSKLAVTGKKFVDYMKGKLTNSLPENFGLDIKSIKKAVRQYFFLPKNKSIEIKRAVFKNLHRIVKQQMRPVVKLCNGFSKKNINLLPWNIRRAFHQLKEDSWRYLLDVGHYTRTHTLKAGKILSFHAKELSCIKKGKIGKEFQFGRVFQLGRIKGNFLFVLGSSSIGMNDKTSFSPLLEEHVKVFGNIVIGSVAADKGYWSMENRKKLLTQGITPTGLQQPYTVKLAIEDTSLQEHLQNRRAGIEPLIGHAKHGGQLGKSRMKSDAATLAAGYGSVLAFNLRQIIRWQQGKIKVAA